jgi:hypothetical protein
MPRIRTIKPEFWASEHIVKLSLRARLLFIGMWNFADDRGVLRASYARLKMEIFPGDNVTPELMYLLIDELLLVDEGDGKLPLIGEFESGNRAYWYITGWHHQRIDRPSPRYPAPPDDGLDSTNAQRGLTEGSTSDTETEGKRKRKGNGNGRETEGKGRERTVGRPVDRTEIEKIDWKRNGVLVNSLFVRIRKKWKGWQAGPAVEEKLAKATACVQLGVLPDEWILGAVDEMIQDPKPKNFPHRWLGKVLAATAKEKYGVDFDQFQRAITVPKKGGDG